MTNESDINKLVALINNEDPKNPLTDKELSDLLKVSRSNITTMRATAGIENSRERRKNLLLDDIQKIVDATPNATVNNIVAQLHDLGYRITINSVAKYIESADIVLPAFHERAVQDNRKIENKYSGKHAFSSIIGSTRSMHLQIEQAKAAVLYPPNGLHTLIIGKTGVGKSALAEAMYNFALESKEISSEKMPFVILNCANYAENPQLLMSQLFGHKKGAFTGADGDREGLVSRADGGIFFLDEVHRLPPDGQEMLFQLIDKGLYQRLGDSQVRKATVMIIAATSEDIGTSLLDTFRRRIPMVISIPSLDERGLDEKYDIIMAFFYQEAVRINKEIFITPSALRALLNMRYIGHIGELRAKIQVACAKGFLSGIHEHNMDKEIVVDEETLMFVNQETVTDEKGNLEILKLAANGLIVRPTDDGRAVPGSWIRDPYALSDEIYHVIESEYKKLQNTGMLQQEIDVIIWNLIEKKIARYIRQLQGNTQLLTSPGSLNTIVDSNITDMVQAMVALAEKELGQVDESLVFCLTMHFNATLRRLGEGNRIINPNLVNVKLQYAKEFEVAGKMAWLSQDYLGMELPDEEIGFIAMYLAASSPQVAKDKDTIGLLLVTHGRVALEMAAVGDRLMGVKCVTPVCIDLDENMQHVYQRLKEQVIQADKGKGVLILVDMGSPESFGSQISEETGIEVLTVTRVDTLMLLDAVRKVQLPEADIYEVAESLATNRHCLVLGGTQNENKPTAFICYCLTGEGCAAYMMNHLMDAVVAIDPDVEFKFVGALDDIDIVRRIGKIKRDYHVIGVAGSFKINIYNTPMLLMSEINHPECVWRFLSQVKRNFLKGKVTSEAEKQVPELFHLDYIFIDSEIKEKNAAITFMAQKLIENGFVSPAYYDSLLEREEMQPTGIQYGVAIPHGYCSDVNRSRVVVMIPQEPIQWGNDVAAKLILLLAFTEENSSSFKHLYSIISNKEIVQNIINCKNKADILRYLNFGVNFA